MTRILWPVSVFLIVYPVTLAAGGLWGVFTIGILTAITILAAGTGALK